MNFYLKLRFPFSVLFVLQLFVVSPADAKNQIFASEVRAYINSQQTDVQALLDNLVPKNSSLKDLTASSKELNILEGISANVSSANLNTLTGGSSSNADSLHTHSASNAGTIDNLDSTQFLRSDTSDTFEGTTLTIDGDISLTSGATIDSSSNGNITVNPNGTGIIQLGTSSNITGVSVSGDMSVSGNISNPIVTGLIAQVNSLDLAIMELQSENSYENTYPSLKPYLYEKGENKLLKGEAHIELSQSFLEAVIIDEAHPLFVKTTLLSDLCHELAVVERNPQFFRVKELYRGTSNCPFLWEASAQRKSKGVKSK